MLVLLAVWTSERLNGAQGIDPSHFLLLSKTFCVSEVLVDFIYACQERIKGSRGHPLYRPFSTGNSSPDIFRPALLPLFSLGMLKIITAEAQF